MSTLPTVDFHLASDERHTLTRIRRWLRYRRDASHLFEHLDSILSAESATGQLILHYSQGRFSTVEFREEARIDDRG